MKALRLGVHDYDPQLYADLMRVAEMARHNTEEIERREIERQKNSPPSGTVGAERVAFDRGAPPIGEVIRRRRSKDDDGHREHLLLDAWLERKIPPRDYLLGNVLLHHVALADVRRDWRWQDLASGRYCWSGRVWQHVSRLGRASASACHVSRWRNASRDVQGADAANRSRYGEDIPLYGYNRDDLGDDAMPPLNEEDGEKWLMREIDLIRPDLIIFDSVMRLLGGVMSDEESWKPTKHLVRRVTGRKIGQIWLHHTGHDGTKGFGTKTREWEWTRGPARLR